MTENEEYQHFLQYVFNEHIRERIKKLDQKEMLDTRWLELKEANYLLRYINQHCDTGEEINSTFTPHRLKLLVDQVSHGIELNNELAEKTGFFDALDAYYLELIEGIRTDYLDKTELAVLKELGSPDPETELAGMVYLLKHKGSKSLENAIEVLKPSSDENLPSPETISSCMRAIPKKLSEIFPANDYKKVKRDDVKSSNNVKPSRRWFKCAGKIVQGAGTSIANIAFSVAANAAVPGITIPIELAGGVVGLASVLIGTGQVLEGVGELRGE